VKGGDTMIFPSYHIERVYHRCPFCKKVHLVEKRWRFKYSYINGMKIKHKEFLYRCLVRLNHKDNEFISAELQEKNQKAAESAYHQLQRDADELSAQSHPLPMTKLCRKCGEIAGYNSWFHGYYCSHCYDLEIVDSVD